MKSSLLVSIAIGVASTAVYAQDLATKPEEHSQTTKATYLITGLHCPPCTRTVESSLRKAKGIRSVKVDWKTKNATVEFDEAIVPAQKVAELIADTPHMMGGSMHYDGWLALKVPDLKNDSTAKQVKAALSKVAGVKQVVTYPDKHSVGIAFGKQGDLTSSQLIDALNDAGIKAENF